VDDEDCTVTLLVHAAADGDREAWDSLVVRYTPLVLSVAARFRLGSPDAADVAQTVWLRLLQHIATLREPAALPGWIVTTTKHECLRLLAANRRIDSFDPMLEPPGRSDFRQTTWSEDFTEGLIHAEQHEALLIAFAGLPERDRQLLTLLIKDPSPTYAEISDLLKIPIGSIGPNRARALDRIRRSPAIAALRASDNL
jgi:RNA polymerase sigma factor (sigma-70 family)